MKQQGAGEPRYLRNNGRNYVLASYMAERIKRAMEVARYEGMLEGAGVRAAFARQQIDLLESAQPISLGSPEYLEIVTR